MELSSLLFWIDLKFKQEPELVVIGLHMTATSSSSLNELHHLRHTHGLKFVTLAYKTCMLDLELKLGGATLLAMECTKCATPR